VAGLSLTEYVAEYGVLNPARLWRFAAGTAHALAGVHAAGVLHRDIKPSNVLLDRDDPVLIDYDYEEPVIDAGDKPDLSDSTQPDAVAAYDTSAGAVVLLAGGGTSLLAYRTMLRIARLPTERRVLR